MAPAGRDTFAAYFEDANEDTGSSIEGTRTYAVADDMPPPKHRPNSGRMMMDQPGSTAAARRVAAHRTSFTESDSTHSSNRSGSDKHRDQDSRREKTRDPRRSSLQYESDREREHQRRRQERKSREAEERHSQEHSPKEPSSKKTRPAVQHGPPPPHPISRGVSDEYTRYGYQQPAAPPSRPRGSRASTYYAGQPQPPLPGGMVWHPSHFPPGHFPPGHPGPPGPPGPPMHYPPPMHELSARGMPPTSPMGIVPHGYFAGPPHPTYSDHLKSRFDSRPPSAMGSLGGTERVSPGYSPEEFGDESAPNVMRRPSRQARGDDDRRKMPPPDRIPQRTMSAAPQQTGPFRPPLSRAQVRQNPPRPSVNRHSVNYGGEYDYEEYDPSHDLFQDLSPEPVYRQRRYVEPARSRRGSEVYEDVDIIPAGRRNRRQSMYGSNVQRAGPKYEAQYAESKIRDAQDYQDAVTGGPKMPLTAEMLQKATRGNPGSQSTRSSGSRDDSEFRRSYTTGITRSSSGNGAEDVTIKVGGAVLTVQGGAEITLSRGQPQIRSTSDKSSTIYQIEDGRDQERDAPRMTLPHRTRAPSHSEQRTRGYMTGAYPPYDQMYTEGNYI